MSTPTLHVRIISPQELILDTQASSVSSKNLQGAFDVLVGHANFISLIENSPIIVRPARNASLAIAGGVQGQKPLVFKFPLSIIMVTENKVNIYTYIQPNTTKK